MQMLMKQEFKHIISLLSFCLLIVGPLNAQDPTFSQVYAAPVYLSPSFAGLTDGSRVALSYRDQWPGIPNTYRTISFSADHFFDKYNSGIGLVFVRDDQGGGQLITQNIGMVYAYEFPVTHSIYVRPGLNFKYFERKIDPASLLWRDQIGPEGDILASAIGDFEKESYNKFDAAASAMVYSNDFWAGVVVDHLIKSDLGFTDIESSMPLRTTVYGGGKFRFRQRTRNKDEVSGTLAFMYRMQDNFQQLDMGSYWYINPFELGLWYRGLPIGSSDELSNNDALIFIVGFNIGSVRLAYSYDLTLSELAGHSGGANEFSLIYRFSTSGVNKSPRGAIPCSDSGSSWMRNKKSTRRYRRTIF
ncbi:type IX secretion system membrane protein, PorP/SprF family [Thermophagus xiamenensis]|uniref:Type IX secretion system membrane protein, PorP/SprF family n=2 Tax=Thermophagus xiamenensis TaxID=385682 RepID=A0A1I1Y1K2_9BACT|nr:type IX secretion system membrane protein, PorP/SprF family [Thermophagus xiamenensis]